jgi:ABC-type transport system involved in multi-copper enzyme maturation permease subunit
MLWYKAWLETRSRFLIALIGITTMCAYYVFHGDRNTLPVTGIEWYNGVLHSSHSVLVLLWIVAVILLAMGGLLREKALGASLFTLALPVSRTRLILVRIAMALVQAVTLVVVPWIAMYAVDAVFGKAHSLPQVIFRVVLLLSGGLIFFALAILISSLVEGEYTAPVVCFGSIALISVALADRPLRTYNPWIFMMGGDYLSKPTMLLAGPIPWAHAAANIAVACVLLVLAIRFIQKRDLT